MIRLTVAALVVVVVLPALLGYAASFSISPIVSQEFRVPVEDVDTQQVGGPEEVSQIASLSSEPEVQREAAPEPAPEELEEPVEPAEEPQEPEAPEEPAPEQGDTPAD